MPPRAEPWAVMMRSLPVMGLAWTVLLVAGTIGTAQTTTAPPLPSIRLPGLVYPGDARAAATLEPAGQTSHRPPAPLTPVPEQKPTSSSIIAPVTPALDPSHSGAATEPAQLRHVMPSIVVTKQEGGSPAAVVGSDAEATTLVEPLASFLSAMLKLISPALVRLMVSGFALALGFGLGYAARSYVSHRRRVHAKTYRGLDRVPFW
jgi:hypothetical protein